MFHISVNSSNIQTQNISYNGYNRERHERHGRRERREDRGRGRRTGTQLYNPPESAQVPLQHYHNTYQQAAPHHPHHSGRSSMHPPHGQPPHSYSEAPPPYTEHDKTRAYDEHGVQGQHLPYAPAPPQSGQQVPYHNPFPSALYQNPDVGLDEGGRRGQKSRGRAFRRLVGTAASAIRARLFRSRRERKRNFQEPQIGFGNFATPARGRTEMEINYARTQGYGGRGGRAWQSLDISSSNGSFTTTSTTTSSSSGWE